MIEIEQSGALNTVQDLGRFNFRHMGVSVSGVMDPLALRAGNLLLGKCSCFRFAYDFCRTAASP